MKKITFILFIILFSALIAKSQWYSVDNGSSGDLTEVKFKNENTGWYVSDGLQIYKTTNGGLNWRCLDIQNYDSLYRMGRLVCYGDTLLLSLGQSRILRSINGGENWVAINTNFNLKVGKIILIKKELLFALGLETNNYITHLIKSTDMGLNWNDIYTFGSSEIDRGSISFVNDSIGYCKGYRTISKTTNGGYNWNIIYNSLTQMDNIFFVNSDLGFLITLGGFYKTTNGGINWSYISYYYPRDMIFDNNYTGYLITPDTTESMLKTTDGGSTWSYLFKKPQTLAFREFFDIEKINNTFYIAARYGGGLYKSTNGGLNFFDISKYETQTDLETIDFINQSTGFIGGYHSGLLQTTNAGLNWFTNQGFNNITPYYNRYIKKIQFTDQNTGWVGTDTGFFKTINGGVNWCFFPTIIMNVDNFLFINNSTGWLIGGTKTTDDSTRIFKTTNGGITFSLQLTIVAFINDIQLFDSLYGYILSDGLFSTSKSLLRTTDGGEHWSELGFGGFESIDIVDRNIAYLAGDNYTGVFKTINGGDNWVKIMDPKYLWSKIKFINNTTGFLTNLQEKNIFYTTNGGSNWIYSIIGSNVGLIDMFLNNQGLGITVGYRGKIYRTTNLGGIIGINNNNEIIPNDFELFQNYPNPFNPSTKIKYQIKTEVRSQGSEVKLIIFDILGREIETMVNSKQKPGIYEVTFDGNNLSSGIYFYRIVVGDFASVKRMVLIK